METQSFRMHWILRSAVQTRLGGRATRGVFTKIARLSVHPPIILGWSLQWAKRRRIRRICIRGRSAVAQKRVFCSWERETGEGARSPQTPLVGVWMQSERSIIEQFPRSGLHLNTFICLTPFFVTRQQRGIQVTRARVGGVGGATLGRKNCDMVRD